MGVKKIDKEEAQDGEVVESSWDLKKIGIGVVVLIIILIFGSYAFSFVGNKLSQGSKLSVLGTSTTQASKEVPPLPSKKDFDRVVENAKNTLSQLTSDNVSTSDGTIQNLINDLQALQGKKGAVGAFCNLVCSNK